MATAKKQFIVFHIIGIIVFLCLPLLLLKGGPGNTPITDIINNEWFWIFSFIYIILFYSNAYWLFPKLYLQKQYVVYVLVLVLLLAIVYFIQPFDHIINLAPPPGEQHGPMPVNHGKFGSPQRPVDFVSIFLFVVITGLSILIPLASQWQKMQQQYFIAQKDKATAELSFLKAQINPHFLFNTLNNLYSLSLTNSEKTPESILRLSNIMRYVTDEVQNETVPLQEEILCINDFIELQKLRLNNKTTALFTYEKVDGNLCIAPLILLPFIENIFKHGISNNENSTIEIKINTKEKEILFYTKNNINAVKNNNRRGTGITNVKKRLETVYPGRHFLKIETGAALFEVHLIIHT